MADSYDESLLEKKTQDGVSSVGRGGHWGRWWVVVTYSALAMIQGATCE